MKGKKLLTSTIYQLENEYKIISSKSKWEKYTYQPSVYHEGICNNLG